MAKHGAIVIDNFTSDQSAHYYYAGLSNTRAFGKKRSPLHYALCVVRQAHHEGDGLAAKLIGTVAEYSSLQAPPSLMVSLSNHAQMGGPAQVV
jgi:hypothetical protein